MVRHDDHGLVGQAEAAQLHGPDYHLRRLARTHFMSEERGRFGHDPGHRCELVGPGLERQGQAGKRRGCGVVAAQDQRVETLVVGGSERAGPVGVLPAPLGEALAEQCGFLLRGRRLGRVRYPPAVRVLVVNRYLCLA